MLIEIFGSVFVVSMISLIGILTIFFSDKNLREVIFILVGLSIGALLGDAFIHLIPEYVEKNGTNNLGMLILSGLLIFFIIERLIRWRHCHDADCENPEHESFTTMVLIGDGFHNFIDGIIIAAAYFASFELGVATTIAIILHEIPQEIGDFGVLVHGGYSRKKALVMNFLSAIAAFLGAFFAILLVDYVPGLISFFMPFTAGSFIYIAASDLIPELHKSVRTKGIIFQTLAIVAGIGMMLLLK